MWVRKSVETSSFDVVLLFVSTLPELPHPTAWGKIWKQASFHTLLTCENNNKSNLYCQICRKLGRKRPRRYIFVEEKVIVMWIQYLFLCRVVVYLSIA